MSLIMSRRAAAAAGSGRPSPGSSLPSDHGSAALRGSAEGPLIVRRVADSLRTRAPRCIPEYLGQTGKLMMLEFESTQLLNPESPKVVWEGTLLEQLHGLFEKSKASYFIRVWTVFASLVNAFNSANPK